MTASHQGLVRLLVLAVCSALGACQRSPTSASARPGDEASPAGRGGAAPKTSPNMQGLQVACAELEAEARKVLAPAIATFSSEEPLSDAHREFLDTLGRCRIGAGGAWALRVLDMDADELALEGGIGIVHVRPDGTRLQYQEATVAHLVTSPEEGNDAIIRVLSHHDYDGDGTDELVVETHDSGYDLDRSTYEIFATNGKAIEWYAPLEGILIESVRDHDGDGALDIVSAAGFWAARDCFGMSADEPLIGVPPVLFHARPDGTFSPSDAVAGSYLREQCPEPPTRLLVGGELNWELAAIERIACARIWGKHPDRVIAQIRREWTTLAPEDTGEQSCGYPITEFENYARIDPPLTLSR